MKYKTIMILICLMVISISSIGTAMAVEPNFKTGSGSGGLPNNPIIDGIRNSLNALSISISCQSGYSHCFNQENIYGNARASADVYVSDPYVTGSNLYVNYKGTGTKYYVYRGITSWSQVSCNKDGCDGVLIGDSAQTLLGSAPSTSQNGVVYVVWDYDSYNGQFSWTWAGFGWFNPFSYNLIQTSTPTPTPSITPSITPTPPLIPGKPVIIPPAISRLFESIWSGIKSFFGLSISGGQTINTIVNQPYSTQLSLNFLAPDTNYADGSYQAKFGEWFIADSNKNILRESGWSTELSNSPYTAAVSFTPSSSAKFYLIGVVVKQDYIFSSNAWTMTETVETKEVQEIIAQLPGIPKNPPISTSSGLLASLSNWIKGLFSWLPW